MPRGVIDVKGKGAMETWFVEGARSPATKANDGKS
jgi:hypothetical protein